MPHLMKSIIETKLSAIASGRNFAYVEPPRRVKEILEEELYFWKEACRVKHPAAVALEGIWSVKKCVSLGSLKPVSQNRNGLLLQPQFYSRHAGKKMKCINFVVEGEGF
ncbi:uncharacterized protein C11orf97 homolog [Egretta garzetta]|uniref:uncharacterized protein C11orf97 homolog n=1 Tax=Egretta garzetta TaxID=188379 RepID=UPI00163C2B19|nr:uncharacterized protein C11orf97 homolog [Egretta garzetta]